MSTIGTGRHVAMLIVMLAQPQSQGRGVLPRRRVAVRGLRAYRLYLGAWARAAAPRGDTMYPMHTIVGTRHRRARKEIPKPYVRFAANETDRDQL